MSDRLPVFGRGTAIREWDATDCTCGRGNEQDSHYLSCAKWAAVLPNTAPLDPSAGASDAPSDGRGTTPPKGG